MKHSGKCESEYCIVYLPRLLISGIYAIGSKFLNPREVFFREIMFCVFRRDIDRQKFCKYGWDNLFRKSSIVKGCGSENHIISNRSINKLVIDTFRKCKRAKK
uniref:Uncharacterized protein n=1 Tax=Rhizophagus irregularis (strain DAOM 181602 / DAOM 197198 / MUCL 43194) TaxID=747089 RepID=U9T6W6_RHIID